MSPRFVDFDADGWTDIVTATYTGLSYLVAGSESGWRRPTPLRDRHGQPISLAVSYERTWKLVDRRPDGQHAPNPVDKGVAVLPFDHDGDGDLDLLLGSYEGRLFLQHNDGAADRPALRGENELLMAAPLQAGGGPHAQEPLRVFGGITALRPVDWDGDGDLDLVCGSFKGGVYLLRNVGAGEGIAFAAPEALVPRDVLPTLPLPNEACYVEPVDYDGDGDLDLVVGGYTTWLEADAVDADKRARHRRLIEEKTTLHAEVRGRIEEMQVAIFDLPEEEKTARRDAFWADPAIKALNERQTAIRAELGGTGVRPHRYAGVWLFRRN